MTHRLLLDVSSLTYRAYFAMRDTTYAPDGRAVGAVYGYLEMVTRLITSRRPDEVVHVYDHEWRPVARTDIYPDYKGQRPDDPDDLPPQFDLLREVLGATGMLQAQTQGWEAEDAIGAFCLDARDDDRLEIVSGDRDLLQLVQDPVVKLLFTVRGVSELIEYDEAMVLERYGVPASRYVDFAILRGDPSDGLPGVKGVGEKTARDLVQRFATLEALHEAALDPDSDLKPALRQKLVDSWEYVQAMGRLVPINANTELDLWAGDRDEAALLTMGDDLGLKGPAQRLIAALASTGAR